MMDVKPFLVSVVGCLADYASTVKGLSLGFIETHVQYSPLAALTIFSVANLVLARYVPSKGLFKVVRYAVALSSFLGAVNNSLVMLGLFNGLVI